MKRTFTLALGLVLSATFATQAFAQDAFPDTPENHWAYEALANMKRAGLLVGYPDGLFRGGRPASRYEMAVALHALYQHLRGLADGFDGRIKAIEDMVGKGDNSGADVKSLRDMLNALKADVDGMKAWGDDIANLKKMASTFEKELASMGVDIEALKKGLNDLASRVTALEKRKPAVDIHGNIGMFVLGGYGEDGHYGLDVTGRPLGASDGDGNSSSFMRDFSVGHEGQLELTGTNEEGPKWKAVLSIGNLLGGYDRRDGSSSSGVMFGNQSGTTNSPYDDTGATAIYFQEFNAYWDTSLWGQPFSMKIGRQGHKVGAYFFERIDNNPYYSNEYWNNGHWYFDGVSMAMKFGSADFNVWGGKQSGRTASDGTDINPMTAGRSYWAWTPNIVFEGGDDRPRGLDSGDIDVDTHFGASLGVPLTSRGKLNLHYILLNSNDTTSVFAGGGSDGPGALADRVSVFGGTVDFKLGDWMLNAGYSQSNIGLGDTNVVDEDNYAWWAGLGTERERWRMNFGYRQIAPFFGAPGDWGRIGIWWNPTDIEGFYARGSFDLNSKLTVNASGEFYTGTETTVLGITGLTNDDEVSSIKLDLVYKVNQDWDLWLGGEWVKWDLADREFVVDGFDFEGGKPEETWYNIGLRYRITDKATWSFRWQMSDYDGKGVSGWNPFSFTGDDRAKGGLITTTLGIRF